ncbi:hypothetical protein [Pseudoprimorskyibacter insulae]|uniref:Uncharacterized protein n=1 Tax=Pseudoprimorskyibacter insulae TaxID=1695997 RepID=A0A2R8AYJ6_9RHOB|nr:hypothetical protein [Pseudoprimorskyibacter insulae]SPF81078.1 hypothetical protein PRI8871_02895 [Pseudoprimorskyibacter insulae]
MKSKSSWSTFVAFVSLVVLAVTSFGFAAGYLLMKEALVWTFSAVCLWPVFALKLPK